MGLLGYIDPDKIEYYRTPHRRHTVNSEFSLAGVQSMPYVEIAYVHTGTRPGVANALVGLGAKGIVIASVGAGAPNGLDKEISDIIKKGSAVVAVSSRVGEGRIVRGNNWYEPGMVAADNLSPQKAALLLTLALTKTTNVDEIQSRLQETTKKLEAVKGGDERFNSSVAIHRALLSRIRPNRLSRFVPAIIESRQAPGAVACERPLVLILLDYYSMT